MHTILINTPALMKSAHVIKIGKKYMFFPSQAVLSDTGNATRDVYLNPASGAGGRYDDDCCPFNARLSVQLNKQATAAWSPRPSSGSKALDSLHFCSFIGSFD